MCSYYKACRPVCKICLMTFLFVVLPIIEWFMPIRINVADKAILVSVWLRNMNLKEDIHVNEYVVFNCMELGSENAYSISNWSVFSRSIDCVIRSIKLGHSKTVPS